MARILLGVTGGVAAYKALELVRLATAAGHAVRVIQTPASRRFVGAASFAALTGAPVLSDGLDPDPLRGAFPGQAPPDHIPLSHLELVRNADLLLVAPASANTLAKLAAGLADNLLCEAALAAACPVVLAPAMNNQMYEHPATQANLGVLRARGATVLDPDTGRLGSPGEWGVGRLPDPAAILAACEEVLGRRSAGAWSGIRVLVSAGGTREPIDAVRFIGNRSSGRMGFALADEAAARGAEVTVVAANVGLPRHPGVRYLDVVSAAELEAACLAELPAADVVLMAAAVADFRPVTARPGKIVKRDRASLAVELEPTTDVLSSLAERRRAGQVLVGFAAEYGSGAAQRGREKLLRKRVDAIVVNDISRPDIGFDAPENEVTIITAAGSQAVARAGKRAVAGAVLDAVAGLRGAEPAPRAGGMLD
ncbi:MAG TPA: bifunctional phosphopantothenoylcysteine decarboxylase/phosphopantothenate--cysteine ligase CoaBC [Solirubrobacteraceae bacterium]|nr:bifunctional phosphopantothenoylcysteine decarboxylase/phosphopantothenate--cysteine ligase CoaBC [Solirubrobacteraceae bacterium]